LRGLPGCWYYSALILNSIQIAAFPRLESEAPRSHGQDTRGHPSGCPFLKALGIDPSELGAVRKEGTTVLPFLFSEHD
jgi:hypothetical protein